MHPFLLLLTGPSSTLFSSYHLSLSFFLPSFAFALPSPLRASHNRFFCRSPRVLFPLACGCFPHFSSEQEPILLRVSQRRDAAPFSGFYTGRDSCHESYDLMAHMPSRQESRGSPVREREICRKSHVMPYPSQLTMYPPLYQCVDGEEASFACHRQLPASPWPLSRPGETLSHE